MTESDWLTSTDPKAMLTFLRDSGKLSERKARLFASACCRIRWDLLPHNEWRQAVEVAEQYAERQGTNRELERAWEEATDIFHHLVGESNVYDTNTLREPEFWSGLLATLVASRDAMDSADQVVKVAKEAELQESSDLLRDFFGPLPFRPLIPLHPSVRTWNGGLVQRLAEEAYQQRQLPSGHLDPDRLGVLADALEEAGVTDQKVLEHLRQQGVHVPGCFALDYILGKE